MTLLALVTLVSGAHAAPPGGPPPPIDAWLSRLPATPSADEAIVVIPRLGNVLHPALTLIGRLNRSRALDNLLDVPVASFGFDILDPAEHARFGLDLDGALFAVLRPHQADVVALPLRDEATARRWLVDGLRVELTATTVLGRPGWRTDAGVVVLAEGYLWTTTDELLLVPYLGATPDSIVGETPAGGTAGSPGDGVPGDKPTPVDGSADASPARDCPRKPGEADVYVLFRSSPAPGCATMRIDPDRLRVDLRVMAPMLGTGWLDDRDRLLGRVGADVSGAAGVELGPLARAKLRLLLALRPPPPPLDAALRLADGGLAVAGGPGAGDVTLWLGVTDTSRARAALAEVAEHSRAYGTLTAVGPDGWRFELAPEHRPPPPSAGPKSPPVPSVAWFGVRASALYATTREDVARGEATDLRDALRRAPGAPDPEVLSAPGAWLYWRPSGTPHDGGPWIDALGPLPAIFDLDLGALRRLTRAAAYLLGHVGEVSAAVRARDGQRAWEATLEVILL